MKVLYDYQIFSAQDYGGISRYFHELLERLPHAPNVSVQLPLRFSNNSDIVSCNTGCRSFFPKIDFRGKRRIMALLNRRSAVNALRKQEFDVFHPTYYDPYFLKYSTKPFVLTVYDLIEEKLPGYYPGRSENSQAKRLLCQKASKIIAISENTKRDIVDLFGIPAEKIEVVYLGSSIFPKLSRKVDLPGNYLLYVGKRAGYKNFNFFIRSALPLLMEIPDLYVVCAGGGGLSSVESHFFEQSNIRERVLHVPATDSALAYAYQNAICMVFPSLYEGFGIPILEAFSCGCPVILAKASSFPEIAADAALYFDPRSADQLLRALRNVIGNQQIRKDLATRGLRRSALFSWDTCAAHTLRVYETLVNR